MQFKKKWKQFKKQLEQTDYQWKKYIEEKPFAGRVIAISYWVVVICIPLAILIKIDVCLVLLIGVPWVFLGEACIWPACIKKILKSHK